MFGLLWGAPRALLQAARKWTTRSGPQLGAQEAHQSSGRRAGCQRLSKSSSQGLAAGGARCCCWAEGWPLWWPSGQQMGQGGLGGGDASAGVAPSTRVQKRGTDFGRRRTRKRKGKQSFDWRPAASWPPGRLEHNKRQRASLPKLPTGQNGRAIGQTGAGGRPSKWLNEMDNDNRTSR